METKESPTRSIFLAASLIGIAGAVITCLFWLFSVQATAQRADTNSSTALQKLENKVDKDQFQQMQEDVRDIKNCLMNGKCRK